ncbi:MAG: branched-chain amino acid ABC transporter substrate-binding protein [Methylovirgula sp.]
MIKPQCLALLCVFAVSMLLSGQARRADAQTLVGPPDILQIGVGGPMTGSDAVFGQELRNGVDQAVEDINATGGLLGRKLMVVGGDDGGDPKRALAVAKRFAADHVSLVVGHFNSGATLAAAAIYDENAILAITPASTNPQITEHGYPLMFRTCGRDDQQPVVAAKFLASLGKKKIAIVHDKTTYGKEFADDFRKELGSLGIKEVLYDAVTKEAKDYSALVTKLKGTAADFVYWGGTAADAGHIVRQMRERGVTTVMISSAVIAGNEFAATGGDAVEGTLMTFPLDPRDRPQAAKIVQEFKARNIDPESYTLYAYAAVEIIAQAAEKAHSLDPKAIAKVMRTGMVFNTVLGDIAYDTNGDITRPDYSIFVWKKEADGKLGFDPLKP